MEFILLLGILIVFSVWFNAKLPALKGKFGEKQVSTKLNKLDPEKYILLNDLYIPKKDGSTTQIDHILISHKGLFVLETKNYQGWILGSENHQYWTQVIYKRKEKLYNPIWQNSMHIKVLKEYLGEVLEGVPIHSIIVFGNQATFKFKESFSKAKVIKNRELLSVIKNEPGDNLVTNFKRHKISQLLSSLYIQDKKEKKLQSKKHVSDIKSNLSKRNNLTALSKCPRCGGELLERQGRYGNFKGCSNYPKCRFTSKI